MFFCLKRKILKPETSLDRDHPKPKKKEKKIQVLSRRPDAGAMRNYQGMKKILSREKKVLRDRHVDDFSRPSLFCFFSSTVFVEYFLFNSFFLCFFLCLSLACCFSQLSFGEQLRKSLSHNCLTFYFLCVFVQYSKQLARITISIFLLITTIRFSVSSS